MDISDVIQCAAELVDGPVEVSDEYRRGVVELATRLCLCRSDDFEEAAEVMGYAVCGVNRPSPAVVASCGRGPCVQNDGHIGPCIPG